MTIGNKHVRAESITLGPSASTAIAREDDEDGIESTQDIISGVLLWNTLDLGNWALMQRGLRLGMT